MEEEQHGELHGSQKTEKVAGYMNLLQTLNGEY